MVYKALIDHCISYFDQGPILKSQMFRKICVILEIKKTRCTPLHPQPNDIIGRYN